MTVAAVFETIRTVMFPVTKENVESSCRENSRFSHGSVFINAQCNNKKSSEC